MKFFSNPNMFVRINNKNLQRIVGLKGFNFDVNGEYETDNKYLIESLKIQFQFEDKKIKADEEIPSNELNEETTKLDENTTEKKMFQCKKCEFESESRGKFLVHTRTHKKEE